MPDVNFPYSRINPKGKNPAWLVQQNLEYYTSKAAEQLDGVSTEVDTVQTDLDTLEATVAALQTTVAALQTQLAAVGSFKAGIATMGVNETTVTVTHNHGSVSYRVVCQPVNAWPGTIAVYVSNKTANTFDIVFTSTYGNAVGIEWILRGA